MWFSQHRSHALFAHSLAEMLLFVLNLKLLLERNPNYDRKDRICEQFGFATCVAPHTNVSPLHSAPISHSPNGFTATQLRSSTPPPLGVRRRRWPNPHITPSPPLGLPPESSSNRLHLTWQTKKRAAGGRSRNNYLCSPSSASAPITHILHFAAAAFFLCLARVSGDVLWTISPVW